MNKEIFYVSIETESLWASLSESQVQIVKVLINFSIANVKLFCLHCDDNWD